MSALDIAQAVKGKKFRPSMPSKRRWRGSPSTTPVLNSFTDVTAERARAKAREVDATIAAGKNPGSLAGVPFAVKNLFDVEGPADPCRIEDQSRSSRRRRAMPR